ncbi:protein MAINTENANCE OF PSII UNDER HIGH LIGHT 1-like [Miscanthus floridulus]|uniref:protein MAINTENANCE OF PSII UNDER HIGH LIGHT 1-like n=1 Tax=Miscanthus floridulus TaxID=154761 RepID=UPI00345A1A5D
MACPAQSMLSASGCIFLRSKPQAAAASHVRGGIIIGGGGSSSSRPFLLTCNASSPPAPTQEDPDCNEEECAPEKEVGSLSAEWLAEERTQVVGTFPPKKRKWGYIEKDTAGQTNIYSVEPMVYVAESAISSGTAGTSAEGAENTAAIAAGLVLITVAAASSILIQVNKSQPPVPLKAAYNGPPLSYYVAKFQPAVAQTLEAPAPAPAPAEAVEAAAPEATSTVEASAALEAQQLSS